MTLAKMIAKWHGKNTGSQKAIAVATNSTASGVSHWLTGRCRPSKDKINLIAKVLGVSPEEVCAALPPLMLETKINASSALPAISAVVKIVLQHPAAADPTIKCAMEQILDMCKTCAVEQKETV